MAFISYACGEGGAKETHSKVGHEVCMTALHCHTFGARLVKEGDSIQTFYEA